MNEKNLIFYLEVNDRLTLNIHNNELQVFISGTQIPLNDFVDDLFERINDEFLKYLEIYERYGKNFRITDRQWLDIRKGESLPAWFTLEKIPRKAPEIMKKLVVPMILRGNIYSLLFTYTEYMYLLDILTIEDEIKTLLATQLLSGLEYEDKWIFKKRKRVNLLRKNKGEI